MTKVDAIVSTFHYNTTLPHPFAQPFTAWLHHEINRDKLSRAYNPRMGKLFAFFVYGER